MRNKWRVTLILGLILLLIGIALVCTPKRPTPTITPPEVTPTGTATPTARPTSTHTPTPTPTISEEEPLREILDKCLGEGQAGRDRQRGTPYEYLMYKEQQVVVTGPPGEIEYVKRRLSRENLNLDLQKGFALSDGTVIQLYQKPKDRAYGEDLFWRGYEDAWVEIVTCVINAHSRGKGPAVAADPNYHLSPAQWAGGESPWTQNGQWAQGLFGGGLGQVLEDPEESFLTQWAFSQYGIDLFEDGQRTVTGMLGEGVRIGIFDSSPFTDWEGELIIPPFAEGVRELEISLPDTRPITMTEFQVPFPRLMGDLDLRATEHLTLTVWHTEVISAPSCPGGKLEYWDLSNHGLFVAGLAHAVAPASEIYLVRVLENDGCGDLYSISEGIEMFVQEMKNRNPDGPIVINLSLGVHRPPRPPTVTLPITVTSLQSTIQSVINDGAVVVAAAGNDSYDSYNDLGEPLSPKEMEIPAKDPGVIGVAASNKQRSRGCFSNTGDIAAPGGNGMDLAWRGNGMNHCEIPGRDLSEPSRYVCQKDDSFCLVGPIYKPCGPRYAYWVGTSFATPLVSGQAALLLGKGAEVPLGDISSIISDTAGSTITVVTEGGQEPVEIPIINVRNLR